jgi:hypothetical protein
MSASAALVDQAASLVRRTRAGDQNAQATLYRIGEESRKGNNRRAEAMALAIKNFIDTNPPVDFTLGAEPALLADAPQTTARVRAERALPTKDELEARKPPLPRGILDKLFEPDLFAIVITRACGYRYGLPAAAVVLAAGPPLTASAVHELGLSQFGSDEASKIFFHDVQFCGDDTWDEVAPHLDALMKKSLAVGPCVGRARTIQAVRQTGSSICAYSRVAGWELGE